MNEINYKRKYLKYKKKYLKLKGCGNTFSHIINTSNLQIPNMSSFIKENTEKFEKEILEDHKNPSGKIHPYSSEIRMDFS